MTSLPLFTTVLLIFGHLTSAYVFKQERTKRNYGSSYQSPLLEGLGYGNVYGSYGGNPFPDTHDFNDGYGSYGSYGSYGRNPFQDTHGYDPNNDAVFQNILRDLRRGNPSQSQSDFNSNFDSRILTGGAGSSHFLDLMKTRCPSCVARGDSDEDQSPRQSPTGTLVA